MKAANLTTAAALLALLAGCAREAPAPEAAPTPTATPTATAEVEAAAPAAAQPASFARDNPTAGTIERVKVTATGDGPTLTAAASRAVQLAIEQVNGKSVDASATTFQGGMAVALGNGSVDLSAAQFAELVTTHSRGAVTDFRVVNQSPRGSDGRYEVTIEAHVAKFAANAAAQRLKVSLAPLRFASTTFVVDGRRVQAAEISRQIRESLIEALTQSERFAVLDRAFSADIEAELDRIAEGRAAHQDMARMGQQLAADYLLFARIDRFAYNHHERELRTTDKRLVWHEGGATLSLRLVNAITGQVELANSVKIELPRTEPTTLRTSVDVPGITEGLMRGLSDEATREVVGRLFPITVVAVNGDQLVLSQGGKSLISGKRYEVVVRGQEIKDPQTGQSLGRMEQHCCVVLVTQVLPQMSYAQIVETQQNVASLFAPGALELRGVVPEPRAVAKTAAPSKVATEQEADEPAPAQDDKNW
jgi:curli biogenesis system outer membrane secretion channel CsgG